MKYCIYCHQNKINGKKYVGMTSQVPEKRWNNGKGYANNKHFFRAIEKYGWHNFSHEILYTHLSKDEAEQIEIKLIKEYDSANPEKGYNIELGGNSIGKVSDQTRLKLSKSLMGHKCSDETRMKISLANRNKKRKKRGKASLEAIEKNRLGHLGQVAWNKGRPWSPEERAKCGGKAVLCVELNTIYRTAHEAGEDLGIDFSSICKCRRGKVNTAGGYHWMPISESEVSNN